MYSQSPLPYGGTSEQTAPLTLEQAVHIYRRLRNGASETVLQNAVGRPANEVVEEIIAAAESASPGPDHSTWTYDDDIPVRALQRRILKQDIVRHLAEEGFREKVTLFWYDHFGTNIRSHNRPIYTNKALKTYREKGLGNFFELLYEVGTGPDMLQFLDGQVNRNVAPNENYARELLELFTMAQNDLDGNPNYTEIDIVELSKALTGWQIDRDLIAGFFNDTRFEDANKTIFGSTDNYDHESVMTLLESSRGYQIAQYISLKLYKYFVYDYPNTFIVKKMATHFVDSGFDIASLLRYILKSKHFVQSAAHGTLIKDPITMHVIALNESGYAILDAEDEGTYRRIVQSSELCGLNILEPVDVSGWGWARQWISTTTLPYRWDELQKFLFGGYNDVAVQNLVSWVRAVCVDSLDPSVIVSEVSKRILSRTVNSETLAVFENAFKGNIPDEEFANGMWNWFYPEADQQVNNLLAEIYKYPEYQLY